MLFFHMNLGSFLLPKKHLYFASMLEKYNEGIHTS
jgi:hypothetical protein